MEGKVSCLALVMQVSCKKQIRPRDPTSHQIVSEDVIAQNHSPGNDILGESIALSEKALKGR